MDIGTWLNAASDFVGYARKYIVAAFFTNELFFDFPLAPGFVADPRQSDSHI
jgi:hypothetical protein